jgi:hypothetical protein
MRGCSDDNFNQAYTLMSSAKMREAFDLTQEDDVTKDRYGRNRFGMSCLMARRMIERGVRYVTINMFETVFNEITWDIHGSAPFSPIACYRDLVGPMFDYGLQLAATGSCAAWGCSMTLWWLRRESSAGRRRSIRLEGVTTGRSAGLMLMAGGGVKGGQVIGSSDEIGGAPKDRPVCASEGRRDDLPFARASQPDAELTGVQGRPIRVIEHGCQPDPGTVLTLDGR